jgi:uncharacterized protein YerC
MNPTLNKEIVRIFFQTFSDLKDQNKLDIFIKDFLTEEEMNKLTKRLAIIYWLRKKRGIENIMENLKVSELDIANAAKLMEKDGIKAAIKNLEAEEFANVWAEKIQKLGLKAKKLV